MTAKTISVILPTYNEEANIKEAIKSIIRFLDKKFNSYEILVVNDGSTDKTRDIVEHLAIKEKKIKLLNHKKNLGYGAALRTGFSNSHYELVFYTDSDNQFAISDLDTLLPLLTRYDIVSGFRIKRQDPLMRIFIAFIYNMMIRLLFHLPVRDIDASFKLYKKKIFKEIQLKSYTGLIDAEILIKARKLGYTIGQVGVRHYPRFKGRTMYEIGHRNMIIAFVRPRVIFDILKEIRVLWKDLR